MRSCSLNRRQRPPELQHLKGPEAVLLHQETCCLICRFGLSSDNRAIVSRVQQITEQLRTLSAAELRQLRAWLDEYEERLSNDQFQAEVAAGEWDELAEKGFARP